VQNPLHPLKDTVATLNMDAIQVIGKTRDVVVIGFGNSELEDILKRHAEEQGRIIVPEPTPENGFYYRSDHFNFARAGVPSLYAKKWHRPCGKGEAYGRQMSAGCGSAITSPATSSTQTGICPATYRTPSCCMPSRERSPMATIGRTGTKATSSALRVRPWDASGVMLHQPSGRWKLGLALAVATALFWATLPVALKVALERVDALTLTWFRSLFATPALGAFMGLRGQFGQLRGHLRARVLLLIATFGPIGNYLAICWLKYDASECTVAVQLAALMVAGGVIVFRNHATSAMGGLSRGGRRHAVVLRRTTRPRRAAGDLRLRRLVDVGGAATWAASALAQKQLLQRPIPRRSCGWCTWPRRCCCPGPAATTAGPGRQTLIAALRAQPWRLRLAAPLRIGRPRASAPSWR
jgi:uncharacterized membrane protein